MGLTLFRDSTSELSTSPTATNFQLQPGVDRHGSHAPQWPGRAPILTAPTSSHEGLGYTSRLSSLGNEFSRIPRLEFKLCKRFLASHSEVLDDDETLYLHDGLSALKSNKEALAKSCVQASIIIRDCKGTTARGTAEYLDDLIRQKKKALTEFINDSDTAMARLRQKATAAPARSSAQAVSLPGGMAAIESLTAPDRRHDKDKSTNAESTLPETRRTHQDPPTGPVTSKAVRRHNTLSSGSGPSRYGPSGKVEEMNDNYTVRQSSFFTVGRVFATLHHSSPGTNIAPEGFVQDGRFGEPVLSKIQRMVVVKEDYGCCWCVPINTYNEQGVAKFTRNKQRITKSDETIIDAHAIIHMSNVDWYSPKWEPEMTKDPISVVPAATDQKLSDMSRINFAKVHTIEHNVKVMHVGSVTKESRALFSTYWQRKAHESMTLASRGT